MMKKFILSIGALLILSLTGCGGDERQLHISSKTFTESFILAEMMAQIAEQAGIPVKRSIPYGDTFLNQEALKNGDVDLYPEYNGTGLILLGQPPIADGDKSYAEVKRLFEPLGLIWGERFGFSNDYAIVMRQDRATALGITKISDLAKISGGVRFVVDEGFVGRPLDGYDAMLRRYGLTQKEVIVMKETDKDKIFKTLLDGKVDVAEVFGTDSFINDFGLVVLEDDLKFFPIYQPAPLVRQDALDGFPALKGALDKLSGLISTAEMRRLNGLVETQGQTYQAAARSFLIEKGLIDAEEAAPVVEAEELKVAMSQLSELGDESVRAVRAVHEAFPNRDIQVQRSAQPLKEIEAGNVRLAVAGADEFFELVGDDPFPKTNHFAEAVGVIEYRMGHLVTKFGNLASSIKDLKKIGVGPENATSHHTAQLMLTSMGLTNGIELVTNDDIDAMFRQLDNDDIDAIFLMVPPSHAKLTSIMNPGRYRLLALSEWKDGNNMVRFPFLRLAQIPANTYEGQADAVETISAQVVLAGPAPQSDTAVGESGPGYIPGVVQSLPLPVSNTSAQKLAAALGSQERVDPKIPTSAALAPQREPPPPAINTNPEISATNLLAILFLVYMIYLFVREEKEH